MPEAQTAGDSFELYLTGAATHGGSQTDPDLSLGNRVSSTEFPFIQVTSSAVVAMGSGELTIHSAGGKNGPGTGVITAVDSTTVNWTPPGGSAGSNVAIANGETKVLNGGGTEGGDKYIVVERTDAANLSSTANVTLARVVGNAVAGDRASSAELAAGAQQHRCVAIKCVNAGGAENIYLRSRTQGTKQLTNSAQLGASGAGTITTSGSFADWPTHGYACIFTNAGALREVIYFNARSATSLTVPAEGRDLPGGGVGPLTGAATDTIYCMQGNCLIGLDDVHTIGPSPTFLDKTGAGEGSATSMPDLFFAVYDPDASPVIDLRVAVGDMDEDDYTGVWLQRNIAEGQNGDPGIAVDFSIMADVA